MTAVPIATVETEARRRVRAVKIALAASFSVAVLEIGLGAWLGLASLTAEGVHTLLDGVDSIIVLITVLLAAKPPDRSHQYGHGKFEALGAAIEGAFVIAAAAGIFYKAVERLIEGRVPERIPGYICAVMLVAAVFYLLVSMYLMREARATASPAILAEALHLRTHIYITAGLAVGLFVGTVGHWPIADTLLTFGVAVCLVVIGVHIFRPVFAQFTDAALPPDDIAAMGRIVERFSPRFVEVHGIRTRQSGAERQIEMHLVVMPETTVADAHQLSHEIEGGIRAQWPTTRISVHIEPFNTAAPDHETWIAGQPKVRIADASPDEREFIH